MYKFIKIGFIGLIAVGILSGCEREVELKKADGLKNSEQTQAESKAVKDKQLAVTKDVREVKPLTVDGIEIPDLSVYQVHATEYSNFKLFMEQTIKDWSDGSEYKSRNEEGHAESNLANIALHYINYFGEEIDKLGLTEDFKELQIIAYKINYNFTFNIQNEGFEKQQETFVTEFTTKLNEIYSKM